MVELADTPDLGSGARACRFKSCYPHIDIGEQDALLYLYVDRDLEPEVQGLSGLKPASVGAERAPPERSTLLSACVRA